LASQLAVVFFIGLGTGINAGAALRHPVHQVVAAESLPDAITVARTWFRPWQNDPPAPPRREPGGGVS
jgi:spermidine synthase